MYSFIGLIQFSIIVLTIAGVWGAYRKAGHSGWASIIPIYNVYMLIKIAGKPGWWLLLLFVPIVNIVIDIIVGIEVAKKFGKGEGFGIGLVFLPFIFFPILAFSDAKFVG